jgi:hypothetical protein
VVAALVRGGGRWSPSPRRLSSAPSSEAGGTCEPRSIVHDGAASLLTDYFTVTDSKQGSTNWWRLSLELLSTAGTAGQERCWGWEGILSAGGVRVHLEPRTCQLGV